MVTLQLTDISRTFWPAPDIGVKALANVNLTVQRSEFVCVVGANGCGKSTLLKIIIGALSPTTGRVWLKGEDITDVPEHRRAGQVALVSQHPGARLAPSLSIEQNMALALVSERRWWRVAVTKELRDEFREVLRPLGLGLEDRLRSRVSDLSGGQVQALTLAMTVALVKPSLLLLDEHCTALDAVMEDNVMAITNAVCREQLASVVMVTHNFEHAALYGDRLIVMHAGSVVQDISGDDKRAMTARDVFDRFMASRSSENSVSQHVAHHQRFGSGGILE